MKRGFVFLFVFLITFTASAQLFQDIGRVFTPDSLSNDSIDDRVYEDSLAIARLYRELDSVRLSEANLRMEFEQLELKYYKGDSLKMIQKKHRIDSLRTITKGAPVVVEEDTLYYIYGKQDGMSAKQRSEMEAEIIVKLSKHVRFKADSLVITDADNVANLMYGKEVIVTITDQDALWADCSRKELAEKYRKAIIEKVTQMRREHGWWQLGKRIIFFILVLGGQLLLFRLTNWLFRKVKVRIEHFADHRLKPFSVQNFEVLNVAQQTKCLIFFASILRYGFMAVQLVLTVPLLFSIFPQTKKLATKILSYIWDPIKDILLGVVHYIPNLFTIVIIWIAVRYLVKLVRYLANEIQSERLKIGGFYADWAIPSFHIARFMLYAFMIAMIYPYLPGSKSGVFQGISVFIGLIFSLGSSTVIGNIIAGLVITYMRSFKIGDRIKLNDTMGNVIEKTPLVIRIRTPKNEVVTLPNSFMMSTQTVNFSRSAREFGLIIHSEVTIGYDAAWRQVHELLINAALNTPGVLEDPRPFVLETSLSDYYPVYQVNAYIRDADRMNQIYSDLHQNIQDVFNAAGVEILSPHYRANRDGNETTIPKNEMRDKYPQYDEAMKKRMEDEKERDAEIEKQEQLYEEHPELLFGKANLKDFMGEGEETSHKMPPATPAEPLTTAAKPAEDATGGPSKPVTPSADKPQETSESTPPPPTTTPPPTTP